MRVTQVTTRASRRSSWWRAAIIWLGVSCQGGWGAMPWPEQDVRYREVHLPGDLVEEFSSQTVPVPREAFEALVKANNRDQDVSSRDFFSAVELDAQLKGNSFVEGTGVVTLNKAPPELMEVAEHHSAFHLLDSNLPLEQPRWRDSQGSSIANATLGLGPAGKQIVLSQANAETLVFDWSLVGDSRERILVFQFVLPPALIHSLRLRLPLGRVLQCDNGFVSHQIGSTIDDDVWTIETGGIRTLRVTIRESGDLSEKNQWPRLRQTSSYQLNSAGMGVQTTLKLESSVEFNRDINVSVDATLTPTRVTVGNSSVPWTTVPADQGTDILIDMSSLARPATGEQLIHIEAVGSYSISQPFRLPRFHLAQSIWVSESIHLVLARDVNLVDAMETDGRCVNNWTNDGDVGQTYEFIMDRESAQLDLLVNQTGALMVTACGLAVELDGASISTEAHLQFRPSRGSVFELRVAIDEGWDLDSDSIEASRSTTSFGLNSSLVQSTTRDKGLLTVALREPATAVRPVTLRLVLRKDGVSDKMTVEELMSVRAADGDTLTWIKARAAANFRLISGRVAHRSWQQFAELPEWLRNHWEPGDNTVLLRCDNASLQSEFGVARAVSPATIATSTEVHVGHDGFQETVRVRIDPNGSDLAMLEMEFSASLGDKVDWILNGRDASRLVHWDEASDRFQLQFSPSISETTQVILVIEKKGSTSWEVPVISIPNTANLQGSLVLQADDDVTLSIEESDGLDAIPTGVISNVGSADRNWTAVFSYANTLPSAPRLRVQSQRSSDIRPCFAWRCDIRSYYSENGRPQHRADFFLQNAGASSVNLTLPQGLALEGIEIDGVAVRDTTFDRTLRIGLPAANSFPCLTVRCSEVLRSLHAIDWLSVPLVQADIKVMQTTWQAWLPPGFRSYDSQSSPRDDTWRSRIFGRFARFQLRSESTISGSLRDSFFTSALHPRYLVRQMEWLLGVSQVSIPGLVTPGDPAVSSETAVETWSERLTRIQDAVRRSRPEFCILVDCPELRRLGIHPRATLHASHETQPRLIGRDRLVQAGLGMVVGGDSIVITSAAELGQLSNGDAIDGLAVEGRADRFGHRLQNVRDWGERDTSFLWRPSSDDLETGLLHAGWRSHKRILSNSPGVIRVYRRDTMVGASCGTFLVGLGLGWALINRRVYRWLVLTTLLFGAALLLPQPGATLAMAAAWGCVSTGLSFVSKVRAQPGSRPRIKRSVSFGASHAPLLLALLGLAISSSDRARADTATPPVSGTHFETNSRIYPIYVPMAKGEPSGSGIVYVPNDFYAYLRRRVESSEGQADYCFTEAHYQGDWPSRQQDEFQLNALFTVTTTVTDAEVPMPSFGPSAQVDWNLVRIDRRPILVAEAEVPLSDLSDHSTEHVFAHEGRTKTITVDLPGEHHVFIPLRLGLEPRAEMRHCRLPIPPVPRARLDLSFPADLRSVAVPSARGVTEVDLTRGKLNSQLGPSTELEIKAWQAEATPFETQVIDQLTLIILHDREATVEIRYRFGAEPFPLRLRINPKLRITSSSHVSNAVDSDIVTIPAPSANTAGISFAMSYNTPIGNFQIPTVEVLDMAVREHWIAIVSDSQFEVRPDPQRVSPITRSQFADRWGSLANNPGSIFSLPSGAKGAVSVTHAAVPTTWDVDATFLFHDSGADFRVNAQFDASVETTLQRLIIPKQVSLERVTATCNGAPHAIRWHRRSSHDYDHVVIFFDSPPPGRVNLLLSGRLAVSVDVVSIPFFGPAASPDVLGVTQTVRLYRTSDIMIVPDPRVGLDEVPLRDSTVQPGYTLSGLYRREAASTEECQTEDVSVRVVSMRRLQSAVLTTQLDRLDRWTVRVTADLVASNGPLDIAKFLVPSSLTRTMPRATDGNGHMLRVDVSSAPRPGWSLALVWLDGETESRQQIELQADIYLADAEGISLPQVALLDADVTRHSILLQSRSNELGDAGVATKFTWTPRGLRAVSLDKEDRFERFEVIDPGSLEFGAKLVQVEATAAMAKVHLLHTTIGWTSEFDFVGNADFDLHPGDLSACKIHLPIGTELLQILVDGQRTLATPLSAELEGRFSSTGGAGDSDGQKWLFQLGASRWPQRVRVIFRGRRHLGLAGRIKLLAPRLWGEGPIAIGQEVWTVHTPQGLGVGVPAPNSASPEGVDETMLLAYRAMMSDVDFLLRERPQEEFKAWLVPWTGRVRQVLRRLNQIADDKAKSRSFDSRVKVAEAQTNPQSPDALSGDPAALASLASRYGSWILNFVDGESDHTVFEPDLWQESQWRSGSVLRCVSVGEISDSFPTLLMEYPFAGRDRRIMRYAIAAGLFLGVWGLPRQPLLVAAVKRLSQNSPVIGVVLGAIWWLCLTPPWAGIVIAFGSIAMWLCGGFGTRPRWRET